MSEESIRRIYERHAFQVKRACSEGHGAALLDEYIEALSIDMASTVFLKMDAEVAKVTPETADVLFEWLQDFPYRTGLGLLECVTSTLTTYKAPVDQIAAAQNLAVSAYQAQLDKLFEEARSGGAA